MREELAAIAPTPRQLAFLRALAAKHGTTFAEPVTRKQARAQIERLRQPTRRRQPGQLEPVTRSRPGLAADSWHPFPRPLGSDSLAPPL